MAVEEGMQALAGEIMAAAREQAAEIEGAAGQRAAEIRRHARKEAASQRAQMVGEATHEATQMRARVESAAQLEARRLFLAAREAAIGRVFAEARTHLEHGLAPDTRRAALEKAVLQAAVALGGGRLTLRTSRQDAPFLTPELLQALVQRLSEQGVAAELEPGPTAAILGGAIVIGRNGRVVVDNSFDARLEREAWELRNEVWQVLEEGIPEAEMAL